MSLFPQDPELVHTHKFTLVLLQLPTATAGVIAGVLTQNVSGWAVVIGLALVVILTVIAMPYRQAVGEAIAKVMDNV